MATKKSAETELFEALALLDKRRSQNRLDHYEPYKFQKSFHNAPGYKTPGMCAIQRALMAANQIGKSFCGGMEMAIHLTGKYPAFWIGHRFNRPIIGLAAGMTNESTRDICQRELFGEPADENQMGTGSVPKNLIGKKARKAGVPNAWDSIFVKHVTGGWSKVVFRAYEQGWEKFMGTRIDVGWCDEEPPEEIWSQMLRATLSTRGILYITFTPESGITKVVHQFMSDLKPGQALIRATWDDAPHMTGDRRTQMLEAIPSHQREMRAKGIPLMGSGLVFQVSTADIRIAEVKIADHWPRIAAVDFGIEHAFAAAWIAWDRDTDIEYLYDAYKAVGKSMPDHVSALNSRGNWIPVEWPHDGLNREKSSGKPLADLYRSEGANMRINQFSNPPAPGVKEGDGGNSVEFGIEHMLHRMQAGRFKVLAHLSDWWDEYGMYHRKDGKIVALNDDLMSATRYASLSKRHAITRPMKTRRTASVAGVTNW